MSSLAPYVFLTQNDDGSADFTLAIDDENHKFSTSVNGDHAELEYEETLSYRMEIRVKEPDEEIWRLVMQSEQMTDYLESNGLAGVRRA